MSLIVLPPWKLPLHPLSLAVRGNGGYFMGPPRGVLYVPDTGSGTRTLNVPKISKHTLIILTKDVVKCKE
jgi:hypothetical protein